MHESRNRGFTLLELVIVMLIMAIVAALSYPSLSRGASTLHLRATGRDVINTFRFAREKAVTEQTGMHVVVDREKQQLVLTDYLGDGVRTYVMPQDVKIQRVALAGTEVTDSSMVVRFLPNGSCESSEILLQSDKGSWLQIATDPITGGARVESDSREKAR
jgi:general secretion pathway protein H